MNKMMQRHNTILELLTERESIEVSELSLLLHVSQVTIRKDLDILEDRGLIIREHGYALLNNKDDMNNRLAYHYDLKEKIAKIACEDIHDGETIMIESGSCCALLALEIVQCKKNMTIITNSAFICDYIRQYPDHKVILLGGEYQKESQVNVGPMVKQCVESFFVDKLFIGTDGFSKASGFTGADYLRAQAVKDMSQQVNHVYVLTESHKFNQVGLVNLLPTQDVYCVVTDQGIPLETVEYLESQDILIKRIDC